MTCPCCFSFFLPSLNCTQKFYAMKRIRRLRSKKEKIRRCINTLIFTSQLSGCHPTLKSDSIVTTIYCKECKTLIVFDLASLEIFDHKSMQPPSMPAVSVPKRDILNKVLQKTKHSKTIDPPKKELDLESFLEGFL